MSLKGKKIVVGITGGIAAYKIPPLIRLLKKDGADVHAVMTDNATRFITELTIETVCQFPVAREMFPADRYVSTHHIDMAEWPDLFVVAPATANFLGKVASGICDDLLTTVICATKKPVIIAPAMNSNMYLNPITQKNMEFLKSVGYTFIDAQTGDLACETYGPGRMAEPEKIFDVIVGFLNAKPSKKKSLIDKRILITAGPCREPIDPVRFISNRSSGKMGYALAEAAYESGAKVTLISGPSHLKHQYPFKIINVETTEEMYHAVEDNLGNCHALLMAAAPADFKVKAVASQKIKKSKIKKSTTLELIPTIDILQSIKTKKKNRPVMVGFALESEKGLANARAKLKEKALDMIVLNSLEEGQPFEGDFNKVTLIAGNGRIEPLKNMPKNEVALIIIERVAKMIKK